MLLFWYWPHHEGKGENRKQQDYFQLTADDHVGVTNFTIQFLVFVI
jgi:hypothetical protein